MTPLDDARLITDKEWGVDTTVYSPLDREQITVVSKQPILNADISANYNGREIFTLTPELLQALKDNWLIHIAVQNEYNLYIQMVETE